MECFRLLFDHLAWIEPQFLSGIRDSRKAGSLWGMMRGVGGVRKSIHQIWWAKGLGLLCWGLKGVQEDIPSEEATRTMHQSTTPSLSQTIWPRWASRQFLSLHLVQTLLPVTFGYSLSSEALVMRQLRRWKRLWRRSLTLTQEFNVCTINNTINVPDIGLGVRVFANGPGDLVSIPGRVIPKTQKMVLDASLLSTQHYKVRIKGKVEQSRKGVAPSPTHWCSSYRKGSLRVTLDYGRQLYLLTINKSAHPKKF